MFKRLVSMYSTYVLSSDIVIYVKKSGSHVTHDHYYKMVYHRPVHDCCTTEYISDASCPNAAAICLAPSLLPAGITPPSVMVVATIL